MLNNETGFPPGPVVPDPYSQLLVLIHHGLMGDAEKTNTSRKWVIPCKNRNKTGQRQQLSIL